MKQAIKEILKSVTVWMLIGACAMTGMKAVDWAIPSPERVLKVEIED